MTDAQRCEPPEHLRGVDGWHWVQFRSHKPKPELWDSAINSLPASWHSVRLDSPEDAYSAGYRYLAPVTPPAVVAGLVEALEAIAKGGKWASHPNGAARFEPSNEAQIARAALAAYRGDGA